MNELKDQRVVVTGSSRGLGLEFCRQLRSLGAEVIATAREPKKAIDLRALETRLEALDVEDVESTGAFARRLDGEPIDVLINNAGQGGSTDGVMSLDFDELEALFRVNTFGPLRLVKSLLPNLRRGRGRKIVHISSRMGSLTENSEGGYYGYRASKAALNMFTRCLAAELGGQGFVCVSLHPGWVRTSLGGNRAPLSVQSSVSGMLNVLSHLGRGDNGRFLDYTGSEIPW